MTRRAYSSTSTRVRDVDETDSGVGSGSSQASSPATSSVSSVETTSDDLIDFGSKTSTFPRWTKGDLETAVAFLAYLLSLGCVYRQTLCFFLQLTTSSQDWTPLSRKARVCYEDRMIWKKEI